jgi:hypothetical protein
MVRFCELRQTTEPRSPTKGNDSIKDAFKRFYPAFIIRQLLGLEIQEAGDPWQVKGKVIPLHVMEAIGVRGGTAPTHS